MKTGLLLALSKFRGREHGWIPVDTLQWLYRHHRLRMAPPGCRVWMTGLINSDIPASVQAACLYDDERSPAAQFITFSVGCVLFQVFAPGLADASLPPETETWLAPRRRVPAGTAADIAIRRAGAVAPRRCGQRGRPRAGRPEADREVVTN